jgi:hypothetical protein
VNTQEVEDMVSYILRELKPNGGDYPRVELGCSFGSIHMPRCAAVRGLASITEPTKETLGVDSNLGKLTYGLLTRKCRSCVGSRGMAY